MRRAERALGQGIRAGQAAGEIYSPGNQRQALQLKRVTDYVAGSSTITDIYALADQADDETFEEVLAEAKAEKKLSRANVVRKVIARAQEADSKDERIARARDMAATGYTSRQIAKARRRARSGRRGTTPATELQ